MRIISRLVVYFLSVSILIFACAPSMGYATLKPGATPKYKVEKEKAVTKEQLDKLTESEKSTLSAEVEIAYRAKQAGSSKARYSSVLDIDLSELTSDELKEIRDYLNGNSDYSLSDSTSLNDRQAVILISTEDFLFSFNFCATSLGTGHALSPEKAEISRFSDSVLLKTVFNGCEVLSLNLTPNSKKVTAIHCTWSTSVPGSAKYADDFVYLLMEVLNACGMKTSDISDVLMELGAKNAFNVGDSNAVIVDGIKVKYDVTSYTGVEFVIERVQ